MSLEDCSKIDYATHTDDILVKYENQNSNSLILYKSSCGCFIEPSQMCVSCIFVFTW